MNCPRVDCKNEAIINPSYGVMPCQSCQDNDSPIKIQQPEFYSRSKQERITEQRDKYSKDLIQPYENASGKPNPEFVKAYPELRDQYFKPEQLNKL